MNILLIRPKPSKETIGLQHVMICEPLELEYLASNIELDDVNIEIIDMIIEKKPIEWFIKKHKPDIVGMTGYITHVNTIKDYAQKIKSVDKDIVVISGGVHGEVVPEDFVSPFIDYIVEANPIKTFNNIINHVNQNKSKDSFISGTYKKGEINSKVNEFNYNPPDRNKTLKYLKKYYYMFHNPCALIKTSFGCPYNCSFCFCKEITGGKYYTRSMDSVVDELLTIEQEEIYIVDDDFLYSREKLILFCDKIQQNNIKKKFLVYGRADFIAENEDVIKLLQENGLRAVIVGFESFKNDDLNNYNKKTSIEQNEKTAEILKKYDIELYATFIIPDDFTKGDFNNLGKWIKSMGIIFVNLQPLTPLPGTGIYKEYENEIIFKREEYEKWDLAHIALNPKYLSIRSYYFEIIKLYYKIIMTPKNVVKLIKKHGLKPVIKLTIGSSLVSWQYFKKMLKG